MFHFIKKNAFDTLSPDVQSFGCLCTALYCSLVITHATAVDSGQYQCDPSHSYPQHVNVHVIDTGRNLFTVLSSFHLEHWRPFKNVFNQSLQIAIYFFVVQKTGGELKTKSGKGFKCSDFKMKISYLS